MCGLRAERWTGKVCSSDLIEPAHVEGIERVAGGRQWDWSTARNRDIVNEDIASLLWR